MHAHKHTPIASRLSWEMGHDSWCMLTFYRIQDTFFHTMSGKTLGFKLDPANLPAIQGADLCTCFCFIWSEKKLGSDHSLQLISQTNQWYKCLWWNWSAWPRAHDDVIFTKKEAVNTSMCSMLELWRQSLILISSLGWRYLPSHYLDHIIHIPYHGLVGILLTTKSLRLFARLLEN